jgi:hypothetical protein
MYIQLKTDLRSARVTFVDKAKRDCFLDGAQDGRQTTYINAARAKMLARALLRAAHEAEKQGVTQ